MRRRKSSTPREGRGGKSEGRGDQPAASDFTTPFIVVAPLKQATKARKPPTHPQLPFHDSIVVAPLKQATKARKPLTHPQLKNFERSLLTAPETRVHDSNEVCRQAWFQLRLELTT